MSNTLFTNFSTAQKANRYMMRNNLEEKTIVDNDYFLVLFSKKINVESNH